MLGKILSDYLNGTQKHLTFNSIAITIYGFAFSYGAYFTDCVELDLLIFTVGLLAFQAVQLKKFNDLLHNLYDLLSFNKNPQKPFPDVDELLNPLLKIRRGARLTSFFIAVLTFFMYF